MKQTLIKPGKLSKPKEQGQSLVELAISLFLLLILLAGIVDLGRALIIQFVLKDAAEEGVVYGTAYPSNCAQILSRISSNIDTQFVKETVSPVIEIRDGGGTYHPCPYSSATGGQTIRVTIPYSFKVTMPFLGTFVGGQTIPLQVTATGVVLRP